MARDPNQEFRYWGSSVTFEETLPPFAGKKGRTVQLFGSGQPFMGADWGLENNLITTWMPGNAEEGTQQNLGPRELPSNWEGEWKRTLLGRHPTKYTDEDGTVHSIVSPHVLREILEDIIRGGIRLRVTWAVLGSQRLGTNLTVDNGSGKDVNIDVKIVREGRVKSFKTPIDKFTDIRWSMELHWVSRGGKSDKVAAIRTEDDYSKVSKGVDVSLKALGVFVDSKVVSIKANVRKSTSYLTLGQLESLAGAPLATVNAYVLKLRSVVSKLRQVGDIVKKLRAQPLAIANSVVDFARNTTAVTNAFIDAMGRTPAESYTLKTKTSALLRATKYFGKTTDQAVLAARASHELEANVAKLAISQSVKGAATVTESAHNRAGDLITVHQCREADTPGSLSMKYYLDADHGVDILKANKLPWFLPSFKKGQIIIIPVLTGSSNSQKV